MNKIIKRSYKVTCTISIIVLITSILGEISLRALPGIIPLALLTRFDPIIRSEIAERRELPPLNNTILVERDDGGPPLRILKPFTPVTTKTASGTTNTITVDENGFCNPTANLPSPFDSEILVLGDSFAWCTSIDVPDSWSNQLQALTNRSVYNISIGGAGLYEYIQLFKTFGANQASKVVVLYIYEGNDLRDAERFHKYLSSKASPANSTPTCTRLPLTLCIIRQSSIIIWIETRSYLANIPTSWIRYHLDKSETESMVSTNFKYDLAFSDHIIPFNTSNIDTDEILYAEKYLSGQISFDLFLDALTNFTELSQRLGFVPVVTYTPSAHTTYTKFTRFEDPYRKGQMSTFSQNQRMFLEKHSSLLGYVFFDLTPALQDKAESTRYKELLYFDHNLHLTPQGHLVIAKAVHQALLDMEHH